MSSTPYSPNGTHHAASVRRAKPCGYRTAIAWSVDSIRSATRLRHPDTRFPLVAAKPMTWAPTHARIGAKRTAAAPGTRGLQCESGKSLFRFLHRTGIDAELWLCNGGL
ncbi:MAG: hypothetical protein AMJ69_09290 [Gammaproteobacteria bacterium SG8_47]|nr:MAG: hypothetical protein AMJ69_09290 [Gammaproteobacteria bacterium SG8_47]